jgi:hypothetical protein
MLGVRGNDRQRRGVKLIASFRRYANAEREESKANWDLFHTAHYSRFAAQMAFTATCIVFGVKYLKPQAPPSTCVTRVSSFTRGR